jgi:hypothetical protein
VTAANAINTEATATNAMTVDLTGMGDTDSEATDDGGTADMSTSIAASANRAVAHDAAVNRNKVDEVAPAWQPGFTVRPGGQMQNYGGDNGVTAGGTDAQMQPRTAPATGGTPNGSSGPEMEPCRDTDCSCRRPPPEPEICRDEDCSCRTTGTAPGIALPQSNVPREQLQFNTHQTANGTTGNRTTDAGMQASYDGRNTIARGPGLAVQPRSNANRTATRAMQNRAGQNGLAPNRPALRRTARDRATPDRPAPYKIGNPRPSYRAAPFTPVPIRPADAQLQLYKYVNGQPTDTGIRASDAQLNAPTSRTRLANQPQTEYGDDPTQVGGNRSTPLAQFGPPRTSNAPSHRPQTTPGNEQSRPIRGAYAVDGAP